MIFPDICAKTDISQKILLKLFFTILTSLVLDYYYLNINISTNATFYKMYKLIQIHFKKAKYKKSVLSK